MKLNFLLVFMWMLGLNISAQTPDIKGGLGLEFGSSEAAIREMMRTKHPDAEFDSKLGNTLFYKNGKWINKTVTIWAFLLNDSNQLHTIVVQVSPLTDSDAFSTYDDVVEQLTTKYGAPTGIVANWKYPYEAKDKYNHGIVALKNSKCVMMSYWNSPNPKSTDEEMKNIIVVEIVPSLDTKVTYQDGVMIKKVKEKQNKNNQNEM